MDKIDKGSRAAVLQRISANPFIGQQELADELCLSRSAVAGHIAALQRERRILGRAYILPKLRPLLCLGGANMDRKLTSLSPLQMHTSNPAALRESFGGVARNVAENLARLGLPTSLITAVGDDASGQIMLKHLQGAGVDASASFTLAGQLSGSYTAVLDADGELLVGLANMDLCDQLSPDRLQACRALRASAGMIIADLNLPQDSLQLLLDDARSHCQAMVLVAVSQPKMERLPRDLRGLRLLILNEAELQTWAGSPTLSRAQIHAACIELQNLGVQDVVVTRGARGVLLTDGSQLMEQPTPPVRVVEVTGAGDAFAAAVCHALYVEPSAPLALACQAGLRLAAKTLQSADTVCPDLNANCLI